MDTLNKRAEIFSGSIVEAALWIFFLLIASGAVIYFLFAKLI